jgi:hypothetical protein
MSTLDAALRYAGHGWPVFPCAPGAKVPAIAGGHGVHDATTDAREITRWWSDRPDRNVAIATGAPGHDVLDVDVHGGGASGYPALERLRAAGLLPPAMTSIRTPSGGLHLYFAGTDQGNSSVPGQHIDFRSGGGYVVAPPSRLAAGRYVVLEHHAVSVPFDWRAARALLAIEDAAQFENVERRCACELALPGRVRGAVGARESQLRPVLGRLPRHRGWTPGRQRDRGARRRCGSVGVARRQDRGPADDRIGTAGRRVVSDVQRGVLAANFAGLSVDELFISRPSNAHGCSARTTLADVCNASGFEPLYRDPLDARIASVATQLTVLDPCGPDVTTVRAMGRMPY